MVHEMRDVNVLNQDIILGLVSADHDDFVNHINVLRNRSANCATLIYVFKNREEDFINSISHAKKLILLNGQYDQLQLYDWLHDATWFHNTFDHKLYAHHDVVHDAVYVFHVTHCIGTSNVHHAGTDTIVTQSSKRLNGYATLQ